MDDDFGAGIALSFMLLVFGFLIAFAAWTAGSNSGFARATQQMKLEHKAVAMGLGTFQRNTDGRIEFVEVLPHIENPCR